MSWLQVTANLLDSILHQTSRNLPIPVCVSCNRDTNTVHLHGSQSIHDNCMTSTCAICCDPLDGAGEPTTATTCAHVYHSRCIRQWLRQKPWQPSCPLCRTRLEPPTAGMEWGQVAGFDVVAPAAGDETELVMLARGLAHAADLTEGAHSAGSPTTTATAARAVTESRASRAPVVEYRAANRSVVPRAMTAAPRPTYAYYAYLSNIAGRGRGMQSHGTATGMLAREREIAARGSVSPVAGQQLARYLRY